MTTGSDLEHSQRINEFSKTRNLHQINPGNNMMSAMKYNQHSGYQANVT